MADYLVTDTELTNVANAIRTKAGLSVTLEFPSEFVSAIANIPTGGTLQSKTVSPSTSQQTVSPDSGYDGLSSVTVNAMPSGSATTPATTITANPTISVSASGVITASVSKTQGVTPSVSAGYVASGTSGTIIVNGSNTNQLTTKSAQTYTPTTTDQTIASGQYLTGAQTIKGDANLLAENIKKDVVLFGVTGTLESGGGGATNVVTGTFTGETTGVKTIDVGYTGNGYPIALYIFNSSGQLSGVDGIDLYTKRLTNTSVSPSYSGTYGQLLYRSVTSGGSVTNKGNAVVMMTYTIAANGINLAAVLSAKSTLLVYIGTSDVNFAQNVQYTYAIVYSE